MTGFATFDAYRTAAALNARQRLFIKTPTSQVSAVPHSLWRAAGIPQAGVLPSAGLGSAVTLDSSTLGAIENANAPAGKRNFLSKLRIGRLSGTIANPYGYILYDRLAHATVAISQATGAFSPTILGTARLNTGEGAQIFMEVETVLGTGTNSFTLTYTNQAGTTGRVTPTIVSVASAIANRVPYADFLWVPLQAPDTGVREITNWTLSAGTQTGNISISLVRPMAWISQDVHGNPAEREFGIMKSGMQVIRSGTCPAIILCPPSSSTNVINGGMYVVTS